MDKISEPTQDYQFDGITMCNPVAKSGGTYFIKFLMGEGTPLYVQAPPCESKNGIVVANRKCLVDLKFNDNDRVFIQWLEDLEMHCHKIIYENRTKWFDGSLEMNDIENYFTPPVKTYQSGKNFIVRCDIYNILGKPQLQVFDEKETQITPESIAPSDCMASIIEVKGIKCSSRSFQIIMEVKQMLKIVKTDIFTKCLIKHKSNEVLETLDDVTSEESHETTEVDNDEPSKFNIIPTDTEEVTTDNSTNIEVSEPVPEKQEETTIEETILIEDPDPVDELVDELVDEPITIEEQLTADDIQLPEEEILSTTENVMEPDNESNMESMDTSSNYNLVNAEEINIEPSGDVFEIMSRESVYKKMYKDARRRAREAKEIAMTAYLEANNIKNTYMLEDTETDSDDDLDYIAPK